MIVAMLYLVGFVVFLLFMLWVTTRKSTATSQIAVEYLDEIAGGDPAFADGREFEEPSIEDMQDLAVTTPTELLEALTEVASSVEASSAAVGGESSDTQGGELRQAGNQGSASIPRWERWEIRFNTTSLAAYAQQLQSFGIELAAVGGGSDKIDYASQLDKPKPATRSGAASDEKRMYMSYRSGQLKEFDRKILAKAGIPTRGRMMLQLYPGAIEQTLATLEMQRAGGRSLKNIRKTVFGVRRSGDKYQFEVIEQRYN